MRDLSFQSLALLRATSLGALLVTNHLEGRLSSAVGQSQRNAMQEVTVSLWPAAAEPSVGRSTSSKTHFFYFRRRTMAQNVFLDGKNAPPPNFIETNFKGIKMK